VLLVHFQIVSMEILPAAHTLTQREFDWVSSEQPQHPYMLRSVQLLAHEYLDNTRLSVYPLERRQNLEKLQDEVHSHWMLYS
jgi:hypothetical protein